MTPEELRKLMEESGHTTPDDLAAAIGVDTSTVRRWLRGASTISAANLVSLNNLKPRRGFEERYAAHQAGAAHQPMVLPTPVPPPAPPPAPGQPAAVPVPASALLPVAVASPGAAPVGPAAVSRAASPPTGGSSGDAVASAPARSPHWDGRRIIRWIAGAVAVLGLLTVGAHYVGVKVLLAALERDRTGQGRCPSTSAAPATPASTDAGGTERARGQGWDGGIARGIAEFVPPATPDDLNRGLSANPIPLHPFSNQKLPPCKGPPRGVEVEISGACYLEVVQKPPCSEDYFEHKGRCFVAILKEEKPSPPTTRTKGKASPEEPSLKQH